MWCIFRLVCDIDYQLLHWWKACLVKSCRQLWHHRGEGLEDVSEAAAGRPAGHARPHPRKGEGQEEGPVRACPALSQGALPALF